MSPFFRTHENPKMFVTYHLTTIRNVLTALPVAVWATPFLVFLVLYMVAWSPAAWLMAKPLQEIAAATVIGITAASALATHYWTRHFFTLLVAIFTFCLFLRELHFEFTESAIYVALIAMCYWASECREKLISFGITRSIMFFFAATILTYFLADIVDRKTLRPLVFILGSEDVWSHPVEETAETVGHMFNMAFVLTTLRRGAQLRSSSS